MPAAAALLAALPAGGHIAAARAVIEALAVPRGGSHPPAALWPVLIAACREVQEWRRALDLALVHLCAKYALNRNMHMCCSAHVLQHHGSVLQGHMWSQPVVLTGVTGMSGTSGKRWYSLGPLTVSPAAWLTTYMQLDDNHIWAHPDQ